MQTFAELTPRGRALRLRTLAVQVLAEHYRLADVRVRLVSMHSFNTIFRVDSPHDRFALRVGDACRIHPTGVEDTEALWLQRLAEDGFDNATIVPTTSGANWTRASTAGVADERVCTLFTWLEGTPLNTRFTADSALQAGQLLAQLHAHASHLQHEPAALELRQAVYFADQDRVATYQSAHGALFREASARVQQLTDDLWSQHERPHLLHGDFGPHNVLVCRSRLRPIDFQDLRVGFAVQDLGISLTDLTRRAPELVAPFTAGYNDVRPLPELSPAMIDTFAAGRSLNIMNLALHAPNSGIGGTFDQHAQRVIDWMTVQDAATG